MRGHRGTGRSWRSEAESGPERWRWACLSLVLLLHAGLYLLLRGAGEPAPPMERTSEERIRLAWSRREPVQTRAAASPGGPSGPAAGSASAARPRLRADPAPAAQTLHTDQPDAWGFDTAQGDGGAAGDGFRRDIFGRGGPDPFAPVQHLPELGMRDRSLGGWLQAEARRRACADLRGALRRRAESTQAIMASMRRWNCTI